MDMIENRERTRRRRDRRRAWIPTTAWAIQGSVLVWISAGGVGPERASAGFLLAMAGGVMAVAAAVAWGWGYPFRRHASGFVRDVVLITACVGGLGMLLGSSLDAAGAGDPRAHAAGGSGGLGAPEGAGPEHGHGHASSEHSLPGAPHGSGAPVSIMGSETGPAGGPLAAGLLPTSTPHAHGHAHASPFDPAFLGTWMCGLMLLFCVPGCLLLCRADGPVEASGPRDAVLSPAKSGILCRRSLGVHGLCTLGMLFGMAAAGAAGARLGLSGPVGGHLAMLAGMVLGSGLVALSASAWIDHRSGLASTPEPAVPTVSTG